MDTPNPPLTGTPSGASDDSDPPVHQRRQRYTGRNPRRFAEKYKEHQPGKYAADVARIEASGKTLAGTHRPVMVSEILTALRPQAGERAVDCTLGYGGHARELLAKITAMVGTAGTPGTGCLLGLDVDPIELPRTEERLRGLGFGPGSFQARHSNYAGLAKVLAEIGWDGADVILADLG